MFWYGCTSSKIYRKRKYSENSWTNTIVWGKCSGQEKAPFRYFPCFPMRAGGRDQGRLCVIPYKCKYPVVCNALCFSNLVMLAPLRLMRVWSTGILTPPRRSQSWITNKWVLDLLTLQPGPLSGPCTPPWEALQQPISRTAQPPPSKPRPQMKPLVKGG